MRSKGNAHRAIEIMFEAAINRMKELDDAGRRCLYEEYREWIQSLGDKGIEQEAIFFKYIGKTEIN
tara:strand:+ start:239 stop:436 length:198 start_codon:yes stop_codon:yes gene_type:complete